MLNWSSILMGENMKTIQFNQYLIIFLFNTLFIYWSLEKNDGIISVYSEPGYGGYKSYKAELVIEKNIQTIGDFLLDINGHSKWVYHCIHSSKSKSFSKNQFIIRYLIDTPWPVKDREVFFHTAYTEQLQNGKKFIDIKMEVTTEIKNNEAYVPITQGFIKIQLWELEENQTKVIFIYNLDPGENLAKTLADPFNYRLTYHTMKNLRNMIP